MAQRLYCTYLQYSTWVRGWHSQLTTWPTAPPLRSRPDMFEIKGMVQSHGPMEPEALLAAARHMEEQLEKQGQAVTINIEFKGPTDLRR